MCVCGGARINHRIALGLNQCIWASPYCGANNLLENGDFELCNFSGWTTMNLEESSSIQKFLSHNSVCSFEMGNEFAIGQIEQNIAVHPGFSYDITLWLRVATETFDSLAVPNTFQVDINGVNYFSATDMPATNWQQKKFCFTAGNHITVLCSNIFIFFFIFISMYSILSLCQSSSTG